MEQRDEIARVAYELYQQNGSIPGRELDNWLEAEKIVHSKQPTVVVATDASPKKVAVLNPDKKQVDAKEGEKAVERKSTGKTATKAKSVKSRTSPKEASL